MKEKNYGWFYGKNGDVQRVKNAPFTVAQFKAEKAAKEFVKDAVRAGEDAPLASFFGTFKGMKALDAFDELKPAS